MYGMVHYDTAEGEHRPVFEALRDALADEGIELATDVEYQLDMRPHAGGRPHEDHQAEGGRASRP